LKIFKRRRTGRNAEITPEILEASARRRRALEYTSAVVVLVGIVGEYVAPFVSALPRIGLFASLRAVWPGVLITAGIAGEILFSMLVASVEGRLQSIQAQRTAEALREAANANLLAEQERLARAKIEERIAFRTLTPEQQHELANVLRIHSGQKFIPYCVTVTPDVEIVCRWLMDVLKNAGWETLSPFLMIHAGAVIPGIRIGTRPNVDDETRNAAELLKVALHDVGIAAYQADQEWIELPSTITIGIGSKPQ
jgi:hypothetical protein